MLCSKCKTNTASFFYTQSINGKESSVALCKACAKSAGLGIGTSMVSPLFNSFFKNETQLSKTEPSAKKCSLCALTFNDILSMGKVGCAECYHTFKDELQSTIRSIHGTAKHTGRKPHQSTETAVIKKELTEEEILRDRLNKAIADENYEEAAKLRDAIKALKGEA